jgi:hypothetical protein
VGITRRLDRQGIPTVIDSSASTRDRYHEKEEAAVRRLRPPSGRAFSGFANGPTILAYSPREPTLPGLAPGGRCKVIGEVFTEDGRLFNYPVHLSRPESGADAKGAKAATSGCVRANVGYPCSVVSKRHQVCPSS